MENRFCRVFKINDKDQLLVLRTETEDSSIIDECTNVVMPSGCGTIIKNTIEFKNGQDGVKDHVKESFEYLDGYDRQLAASQHKDLLERIEEFMNPNA